MQKNSQKIMELNSILLIYLIYLPGNIRLKRTCWVMKKAATNDIKIFLKQMTYLHRYLSKSI